ncbi:MAG: hypothetical protein AAF646_13180 [Pseudomonadota bacterium]
MRILIILAATAAIMAGLVFAIVMAAALLSRGASTVAAQTTALAAPKTLSRVAFAVLWLLVAGAAAGLIGGA